MADASAVRAAWLLATDRGPFYLKRLRVEPRELPFVLALHDHLAAHAWGIVPEPVRTRDGRASFTAAGGAYLLLSPLPGKEADYKVPGESERTAAGLADFHQAAKGFRPPAGFGPRRYYGTWRVRLELRLRDLDRYRTRAENGRGRFDRSYLALWPDLHRQAVEARSLLEGPAYERLSLRAAVVREICHHDLAHRNVLLDGKTVRFLDLDYAVGDTILHDLVNLAGHLNRLHNWAPEWFLAALGAYWRRGYPGAEACEVMAAMLLWPQDYWQIGRQYYDERQPWPEEEFLALLARKCGSPQARLDFLAAFRRELGLRH